MTSLTTQPAPAAPLKPAGATPKLLGFVCEWSVGRTSLIDDDGHVRGMEHVRTVKIPCSGFVKPEWVQLGFESGAQGVFVLGCPLGDCHFNEGNFIISERLAQLRKRLMGRKVIDEETRVAELYLGVSDGQDFLSVVRRFSNYVAALPELAPPKKTGRAARAEAAKAARPTSPPAPAAAPGDPPTPQDAADARLGPSPALSADPNAALQAPQANAVAGGAPATAPKPAAPAPVDAPPMPTATATPPAVTGPEIPAATVTRAAPAPAEELAGPATIVEPSVPPSPAGSTADAPPTDAPEAAPKRQFKRWEGKK